MILASLSASLLANVGHLPPAWADDTLQTLLFLLIAAGATVVVLCRQPTRQVVFLSFYGIVLAVGFFVLQAPDVTLSEITVGAVLLPLLLVLTLAKLRTDPHGGKEHARK